MGTHTRRLVRNGHYVVHQHAQGAVRSPASDVDDTTGEGKLMMASGRRLYSVNNACTQIFVTSENPSLPLNSARKKSARNRLVKP